MIAVLDELLNSAELRRSGFTSFVALTYGVDLPWFEQHLGRQLRVAGVRRFLLFADGRALDDSLGQDGTQVEGAGNWYSIVPVHLQGAFHPKLLLLVGPARARLYVGSGNLRPSGLGRNLEIFERWDASTKDGAVDRIFRDVRRYLDGLLTRMRSPLVHVDDVLRDAFGQLVFRQPQTDAVSRFRGALPTVSLFDTVDAPPSPAGELVMTAPYFDSTGALATDLATRLGASSFEVLIDLGMTNMTAEARTSIQRAGGRILAFDDEERPVHAKGWFARGADWARSIHGSANLSTAAWRGHNAEIVIERRDAHASVVEKILRARPVHTISAAEWGALEAVLAAEDQAEREEWDEALRILSATRSGEHIDLEVSRDADLRGARLACRARAELFALPIEALSPGISRAHLRGRSPAGSVIVRLESDDAVGPWTVVHDVAILRSHARDPSPFDEDATDYFAGARDADANESLLELLSAIAEERHSESRDAPASSRTNAGKDRDEDWVWVTAADFAAAEDAAAPRPRVAGLSADGRPDPGTLLTHLMFGDGTPRDQSPNASDPDLEDNDGTANTLPVPAPPRQRDLVVLVKRTQEVYLKRLAREDQHRTAARLLQEVVILLAAFQDAARKNSISDRDLANSLVTLVGAVLGENAAPLPLSLHSIPPQSRIDVWAHVPVLASSLLAIYNACLVNAVVADEPPSDSTFSDVRAVLWVRNVVRHSPWREVAALHDHIEHHLPRLRRFSVLWIADRWPYWDQVLPFEEFVRDSVRDACLLERIDSVALAAGVPTYRGEGDETVVGTGRDGRLAVGFVETDDKENTSVMLFDGAFQRPKATEPRRNPRNGKTDKVRSLSQVEELLQNAQWTTADIRSALSLLDRLE